MNVLLLFENLFINILLYITIALLHIKHRLNIVTDSVAQWEDL